MKGSGCNKCPVNGFECDAQYRGQRCAELRSRYDLGNPITNTDRIRSMSDEELAVFLYQFSEKCCDSEYGKCVYCPRFIGNSCDIGTWLQQEAEEE